MQKTRLIEVEPFSFVPENQTDCIAGIFRDTLIFHASEQSVAVNGLQETDGNRREMRLASDRLNASFALATISGGLDSARRAEEQALFTYSERIRPLIAEGESVTISFN